MLQVSPRRKSRREQFDLFSRPPNRPAWDQLPAAQRDAVRRLLVQMFVTLAGADVDVPDEEVTHE